MSVRVVARVRPLLKPEIEKDIIVQVPACNSTTEPALIKIPNPKNAAESFSFQFNSVYDQDATQQCLFDNEISPTVKHLFNGFDVTVFAYGVTGTGKTHTMRGGKVLAERGVIPRLLSSIYRKGRKIEKDSEGQNRVEVTMSYYEIYNDRVFDLFEPPEKRTLAGLPIRDNNGKTVVAGLTERPCATLKDFESLYDQANVNRSTSATKLNAQSSRSHAILCVKVSQHMSSHTLVSTVSAIDLAGSEDNRRTENGKERLVESSSINKSLFVLAQCVEAISKKQSRIPYRESKMTRILSLGQNNGLTVMILNIAPVRSYHLDTQSSLNFANRTKKIEIREVENEPIFRTMATKPAASASTIQRQPLRPLPTSSMNSHKHITSDLSKPAKAFSVYAETPAIRREGGVKRSSDSSTSSVSRPPKSSRPTHHSALGMAKEAAFTRTSLEELVDRMVEEKLASKALTEVGNKPGPTVDEEMRKRLELLEQRIGRKEDARAEGLQYLLMAKQHQAHNEDASALKMYQLAFPFFPHNEKLAQKMLDLRRKMESGKGLSSPSRTVSAPTVTNFRPTTSSSSTTTMKLQRSEESDDEYRDDGELDDDDADALTTRKPQTLKPRKMRIGVYHDTASPSRGDLSPRTTQLLRVINTRDVTQIRSLRGVGTKKAEAIVNSLCCLKENDHGGMLVTDLQQLGSLKGVGLRSVEAMRCSISI
ncbi:MAG: hypothetical protein M1828_004394 [Chrysothrix sp. TS-e1954]|nr:MAG: hypothetical protein M1828_004394 [Chrysothrix sp. TS-e1954]